MKTALSDPPRKYIYGEYVYSGGFPIPIGLTSTEKQKCKNENLKYAGQFLVDRKKRMAPHEFVFRAVMKKDVNNQMSSVISENLGTCDDVETKKEFQGCGLAKYLVATCFQDAFVLGYNDKGVDVNTNKYWVDFPGLRNEVSQYCETVTHLRCIPLESGPNAVVVCISYLRAGKISGFDLLFTISDYTWCKKAEKTFKVFNLGDELENDYKANADEFIQDNGCVWFYCKCKKDEKENCMKMKT